MYSFWRWNSQTTQAERNRGAKYLRYEIILNLVESQRKVWTPWWERDGIRQLAGRQRHLIRELILHTLNFVYITMMQGLPLEIHQGQVQKAPLSHLRVNKYPEVSSGQCPCLSNPFYHSVVAKGMYYGRDKLVLLLGATRRPYKVVFSCTSCGRTLGETFDSQARDENCYSDRVTSRGIETMRKQPRKASPATRIFQKSRL